MRGWTGTRFENTSTAGSVIQVIQVIWVPGSVEPRDQGELDSDQTAGRPSALEWKPPEDSVAELVFVPGPSACYAVT